MSPSPGVPAFTTAICPSNPMESRSANMCGLPGVLREATLGAAVKHVKVMSSFSEDKWRAARGRRHLTSGASELSIGIR